jgi:hypothetical protein
VGNGREGTFNSQLSTEREMKTEIGKGEKNEK